MAYMSQERKAQLAPRIKEICKRYKVKASLRVVHHSTLTLNIQSGAIDFFSDYGAEKGDSYIQVNPYWFHNHFNGVSKAFLAEVIEAMNDGNWDKSDIQTDYFNVGWYININVGKWDKPYLLTKVA